MLDNDKMENFISEPFKQKELHKLFCRALKNASTETNSFKKVLLFNFAAAVVALGSGDMTDKKRSRF